MYELLPEVRDALTAAQVAERDKGAQVLALQYAALIDNAAPDKTYAKSIRTLRRVVEHAASQEYNPVKQREIEEAWDKIITALAQHSVASDLGPKLLAALTSLGATLAGRKEQAKKDGEVKPMASPLAAVRDLPAPWRGQAG